MNVDRYGVRGNAPESSVTYSDLNREDAARDRRTDERSEIPGPPTWAKTWERRGAITDRELLSRCRMAAKLTSPEHIGPDHVDDVSAALVCDHLDSIGRLSDERVTLSALCGDARHLYRSITTEQNRIEAEKDADRTAELMDAALRANTPAGLGLSPEEAEKREKLAELQRDDAYRTAGQLCRRFHAPIFPDTPVWLAVYGLLRNVDAETVAAERRMTTESCSRARRRGAETLRERFSASTLLTALNGASAPGEGLADLAGVVIEVTDGTRDARHHKSTLTPRPNLSQPECETEARFIGHRGQLTPVGAAMSPTEKRAAFRWAHTEYRARMYSAGQGAAVTAEAQATARPIKEESLLTALVD